MCIPNTLRCCLSDEAPAVLLAVMLFYNGQRYVGLAMAHQWYVLRSKPNQEEAVWRQARAGGFEVFYPRLHVQPTNPRSRKIKPYFPGYLFVRFELNETGVSTFRWMPYAVGLVCFDGVPADVPDNVIAAIRQHIDEVVAAGGELFHQLKSGDPIRIQHGPFAGYEGIFDTRLGGGDRVQVLLKMLNDRYVPMQLCVGQIQKN
jgi:transcriptional antiterminator RfaH